MSKKSKKKDSGVEQAVQEHLDDIKKDLQELRAKLGMTKQGDFTKLPLDTAKKISDTASEIMKTASEVVEKTLNAQYAAIGAIEGGKKALKEEIKQKKKEKS